MIERFIAPALTFAVLLGGHIAIATALFTGHAPQGSAEQTVTARAQAGEQAAAKRAS
jgi:hypothetical protein